MIFKNSVGLGIHIYGLFSVVIKFLGGTGCSLNIVFFPRILESLPPIIHRQHSAAIGRTKNYQPIGVTLFGIALRALKIS